MEEILKQKVREYLLTLNIPFEENVQVLDEDKFEPYDFYFRDNNLAIDVNDFKNHQQNANALLSSVGYHKSKVITSSNHNIKLIILWQHWLLDDNKWNILKNIIEHTFNLHTKSIFARKCEVKWIDRNSEETKEFYKKNALFGHRGGTHCVGLFYNDELIMAMTNRLKQDGETLLCERMACKSGYNVNGGVSKIIKFVERNYNFKSWEFFIVTDYGQGFGLEASGFKRGKTQTVLMQYQVHEDICYSRGRGSYREFMDNIKNGVENRVMLAGTTKFTKLKP
jgi:hypothetical protein